MNEVYKDPIIIHLSKMPMKKNHSPPQRDVQSIKAHSRRSSRNDDLATELASAELRSSGIVDIHVE